MENIDEVLSIIIILSFDVKKKKTLLYIQASAHQKHHGQLLGEQKFHASEKLSNPSTTTFI